MFVKKILRQFFIVMLLNKYYTTLFCSVVSISISLAIVKFFLKYLLKLKKKKQKKTETKDSKARLNRTHKIFQKYIEENPEFLIVEMDTVEGTKGSRVLLTLLFRTSKLMLAFILYEKK